VAILGIGGLGHLGMQFAAKMGFNTVAIARGPELGAHRYSKAEDAAKVLTELGGAKVILATVTNAKAMSVLIGGLGIDGKLLVVGVSPEAIEVSPLQLIGKRALVAGWPSGRAADPEDTMRFSALEGVTQWSKLSRSPRPPKD
jgi:D-arabinose 1-dehydrogenase-like Zn-dependent alcohol dehydrogenase